MPIDHGIGLNQIVRHRHARQFDDAAFDGVHQAEIGHHPGEENTFIIARAAKEERRSREVVHGAHALRQLVVQRLYARNPQTGCFLVLGCLLLVVTRQWTFSIAAGLMPIAVMRFVVDDIHTVEVQQLAASSGEHFGVVLGRDYGFRRIAL
ncbi:hypothetical protein [Rhodopseudomonas sp. BR0G17]|uniref:hypothetical protein n=1 Tax=Rhodopseudomonas sp. BR0G17 TaxID=2269368 RepID=UPI0032DEBA58